MNQSSDNGRAAARQDPLSSLAARLPDPQDREWYAALVSYIHSLPPDDELVKVAQLFGFLTLMGRQLPDAIAAEQSKLRDFLLKAHHALQQEVKTNASYHEKLNERLSKLPVEIAAGVQPEAIAKAMSESFRQQIRATGIQEAQALLSLATAELKTTAQSIGAAVQPITERYGDLAIRIENQAAHIDYQAGQLARTADTLKSKNVELLKEVSSLQWYYYLAIALCLMLLGGVVGATWEHRNIGELIVNLQSQVAELHQTIKAPAAVSAESTAKHAKKK